MIQYDNKNWFSFILRHGGKHVEGMWWSMLVMALVTFGLVLLEEEFSWFSLEVPPTFHTVIGLVLGLLLVFRTNSAYDRWWEGRKQLGVLVNTTRNLAIKLQSYVSEEDYPERNHVLDLIYALAFAIKEHLRLKDFSKIEHEIPVEIRARFMAAEHKPNFILGQIAKHLSALDSADLISPQQLITLEKETTVLINVLGACERIRATPIPMAYALHLKRVLLVYCSTLPFSYVGVLHWWAIPVVIIVFYTMVGIELIGEEIEDPFGLDDNDLPVDELCEKIKGNINEIKTYY